MVAPTRAETAALREALAPIAIWLAARDGYGFSSELTEQEQGRYLDEATGLVEAVALPYAAALAERDEARRALERDRSTVAVTVNKMRESLRGRAWLLEGGRGPYEWDDDRFREEFSQALDEIAAPLDVLRGIARDWSNCPTDQAEIDLARADRAEAEPAALKARIAALESALERIRLRSVYWAMRGDVSDPTIVVEDDGQHFKVLVLDEVGRIARTALAEGTGHADAS